MLPTMLKDADFSLLEAIVEHTFRNQKLLLEALTHKSYQHESEGNFHNERLEFLGDAVLDLAISDLLMNQFPQYKEGELSLLRASLVNEQSLAEQADNIQLGQWLYLGRGEEMSGGRTKPSLLADAFEALLGALYQETNFDFTKKIIYKLFEAKLKSLDTKLTQSSKSALQEWLHQHRKQMAQYALISVEGPEHHKRFTMGVYMGEKLIAQGSGYSKKEAEHQAAWVALEALKTQS